MTTGQAFRKEISPTQRRALHQGCIVLIDMCFEDLKRITEDKTQIVHSTIAGCLPARYLPKYTPGFLRKFLVCIVTVAWKLAQPFPPPLACVAEELAANAIIKQAEVHLEMDGHDPDLNILYDLLFEDVDFEYLFDDAYDGIDETQIGKQFGMTSLRFDDWFVPFRGNWDPDFGAVHPFIQGDELETDEPKMLGDGELDDDD